MGQLVQQAIEGLKDAVALRNNSNDSIWIAGDLLARFHSNNRWKSGFADIDAEVITVEDAEQLKQALLNALEDNEFPAVKGSILYALRKTQDPNLRPLYIAQLEDSLRLIEGSSLIINACLDGLGDIGEDAFEREEDGSTSQSSSDVEKNWRQARKYITRLNPTMLMPFPYDRKFPKDNP